MEALELQNDPTDQASYRHRERHGYRTANEHTKCWPKGMRASSLRTAKTESNQREQRDNDRE
jgi:hypothetical protein